MHSPRSTIYPALALAAAVVPSVSANAQETGVAYSGISVSEGYNVYAGAIVSLPGARLGDGFAIRGGVSGGRYEYDTQTSEIDADYITGELALVYQSSGQWGWANFSAGPRVTDTTLTPLDPANERAGTRFDVAVQTDGAVGQDLRLEWFGSLGVVDTAYFTEFRLGQQVDGASGTRLGLETGFQGDDTYSSRKLGGFVSTQFGSGWEGRISGGAGKLRDRPAQPYVSVALSKVF